MQNDDDASPINSQAYMQGWSDITSLAGWSAAPSKNEKQGWLQGFGICGWGENYKGGSVCLFHLIV